MKQHFIDTKDALKADALKALEEDFNEQEYLIKRLRNKIQEYETTINADSRVQEVMEENKKLRQDYHRGFPISEEEQKNIDNWIEKHTQEKHGGNRYAGAIGGRYTFKFTPTSIGIIGTIRCSCGDTFTFSDL